MTLDMSTAQPIAPQVTLDMSTAQPIAQPDNRSAVRKYAEDPNNIPLSDYSHATEYGLNNLGKGIAQGVVGAYDMAHAVMSQSPEASAMQAWDYLSKTAHGAADVPAAVHDINQSPDATNRYLRVAADTSGQAGGQAIDALASEGMARGVSAATPKVVDAIAEHPAFIKASNAIRNITPKQLAGAATGTAAGVGAAAKGHLAYAPEAATAGAYFGGRAAETFLGKARANAPIFAKPEPPAVYPGARFPEPADAALGRIPVRQSTPLEQSGGMAQGTASRDITPPAQVYRDATRQNVPYAGELDEMSDRLANQLAAKKGNPAPTAEDHLQAKSVLDDALKSSTDDVVDSAVPKTQDHGTNLQTKAQVDFHLQRGDVAGAESALDSAVQTVSPGSDPSQLFTARTGKVPSTMEIRERVATEPGSPADIQETRGIQEQMRDNLQRHQWSAESEARREFIARNSTGYTKTWGTQAQRDAAHATAMAADSGDMTDLLEKSLAQVRSQK